MAVCSKPKVRGLSLCSGIGGLDLGLERSVQGYRTICYVEREAFPAAVLAARMEEGSLFPAPIYSDLRSFDGFQWAGCVDILLAGYPCRPYSLCGKGRGASDPRHLWPEVFRIICEVQPRIVFLENVLGYVRRGLSDVLRDLASVGFDCEWGVFSAAEAGRPHLRKRVFALAYSSGSNVRVEQGRGSGTSRKGASKPRDNGQQKQVAHPNGRGRQEQRLEEPTGEQGEGWGKPNGRGPYGEQQHASKRAGWPEVEPDVGRTVPNGFPRRVDRLRAIGNAVAPEQAAMAFRELYKRATGRPQCD